MAELPISMGTTAWPQMLAGALLLAIAFFLLLRVARSSRGATAKLRAVRQQPALLANSYSAHDGHGNALH